MTENVVELRDVSKVYPGDVAALSEIDLTVAPGEGLAIVGPSGSGKSTMLHIMGTLDQPSAGTVKVGGYDIAELSDKKLAALRASRIGFVFQRFHLSPNVSALDNVADGLLYSGAGRRERERLAEDALERVGLGHRLRHRPHELSGGERQRVAIARAILGEPALLLADEPTGNLDTESGARILALLLESLRLGTTVVVITHDQDVAASLPRQVHIRDGRIR